MIQTHEYRLVFNTPAFLGNASQQAQWRTPPIKALLRQWWRVAYAAQYEFKVDVAAMRHEEGVLFGHAWLTNDTFERNGRQEHTSGRKSAIRIRLDAADTNALHGWANGKQQGVSPLASSLETSYAWFGLIKRPGLPDRTGIQASLASEGCQILRLAIPDKHQQQFKLGEIIALMNHFGLLGSRSRGGWGALHVEGIAPLSSAQIRRYTRPLDTCLQNDWPMSLAADRLGPCIWQSTEAFTSWDKAMRFIAAERRHVRTSLKGFNGRDLRPALGFASPGRMPSPLRWKVARERDGLKVRIFAMPHRIPDDGGQRMTYNDLQAAWKTVCDTLDAAQNLSPRKP